MLSPTARLAGLFQFGIDEVNHMINTGWRLRFIALPLLVGLSAIASAQDNLNTTTQIGKVNINRTYQCGDQNLNSTYQEGKVNINRTVQVCGKGAQGRGLGGMRGSAREPGGGARAIAAKGASRR
jgi:hypothetical protein